jgi:hypothetical protein
MRLKYDTEARPELKKITLLLLLSSSSLSLEMSCAKVAQLYEIYYTIQSCKNTTLVNKHYFYIGNGQ